MSNHEEAAVGVEQLNPPGTVTLITTHGGGGGEVILIPTPSSDPNDPLNWPKWRKFLNHGLLTVMTLAIFTALSIQQVFWFPMTGDLNVTYQDLANGQAVQLVGLACSCVIFIPFTKKYGRRSTYVISTALVAIGSWWTGYMTTKVEIYLTNLLYGLAGATNEVAVEMTIKDMFFVHQRATAMGIYFAAVMAGSSLTPMIAGVQAEAQGWRMSYITLAAFMTAITVIFIFAFEETKYVPIIQGASQGDRDILEHEVDLDAKDKVDLELAASTSNIPSAPAKSTWQMYKYRLRFLTPTDESLGKLFMYPIYTSWIPHVVYGWLQLASGLTWLVVLASVLTIAFAAPPYNFNPAQVGFMYTGPTIGTIFGFLYGGTFVDWATIRLARRNGGVFEPEMRLYPMIIPSIFATGGLIMFGATLDRGMHYVYPSIGSAMFAFGFGSVCDISLTMVLDAFPNLVGQTFVAITFFRNALSIIGSFTITPWMENMGITNMFILCAFINLFMNALAIPLIIWGKKIRIALAPRYYKLCKEISEHNIS